MKEKNKYTRYEKTRIVSSRALQIAQGSPILIKLPKTTIDPTEIAKLEWEAGVIPIEIKQPEAKTEAKPPAKEKPAKTKQATKKKK